MAGLVNQEVIRRVTDQLVDASDLLLLDDPGLVKATRIFLHFLGVQLVCMPLVNRQLRNVLLLQDLVSDFEKLEVSHHLVVPELDLSELLLDFSHPEFECLLRHQGLANQALSVLSAVSVQLKLGFKSPVKVLVPNRYSLRDLPLQLLDRL